MISLFMPSDTQIKVFLDRQRIQSITYGDAGFTQRSCPLEFDRDHNRIELGRGLDVFRRACDAISQWRMFPKEWTAIRPETPRLEVGSDIAMLAHLFGVWWWNACRIMYLVDDLEQTRTFGFAYGTLPSHVEMGEERFMVELDNEGVVWYDILAYSRPRHPLVRLMYPLARKMQRRFVRDSQSAMRLACS